MDGKALAQLSADQDGSALSPGDLTADAAADVEVSTRFKAISGKVDQAGGLAVRLKDQNNYYVTRANALEDNVRFYRVVNGPSAAARERRHESGSGEWHTLTLRAEGDRFTSPSTASSSSAIVTRLSRSRARSRCGRRPTALRISKRWS